MFEILSMRSCRLVGLICDSVIVYECRVLPELDSISWNVRRLADMVLWRKDGVAQEVNEGGRSGHCQA